MRKQYIGTESENDKGQERGGQGKEKRTGGEKIVKAEERHRKEIKNEWKEKDIERDVEKMSMISRGYRKTRERIEWEKERIGRRDEESADRKDRASVL